MKLKAAVAAILLFIAHAVTRAADSTVEVVPDWKDEGVAVKTHIGLQVCPEPPMFRGKPAHARIWNSVADLRADYNRFNPWQLHPRIAVAELKAPTQTRTFWDFRPMDEMVGDFMRATGDHPVIFSVNVVPKWMYTASSDEEDSLDHIDLNYSEGLKFSGDLVKKFAEYQARVASWYINGGFRDELGAWHESGHRYSNIEYWEPMNEPNGWLTPAEYVTIYDAVVKAVHAVAPKMKFAGPALMNNMPADARLFDWRGEDTARHFVYFLSPKNHEPGIPIDMLSYHLYTASDMDENPEVREKSLFVGADAFLMQAYQLMAFKSDWAPNAKVAVTEVGTETRPFAATYFDVPESYWNLTAAVWAYLYANLALLGVDILDGTELIDYPGEWAGSTLLDWNTGSPKPAYSVIRMLREEIGIGDRFVKPSSLSQLTDASLSKLNPSRFLHYQGILTIKGEKKVLMINKSKGTLKLHIPGADQGYLKVIDLFTKAVPSTQRLAGDELMLRGYAVAMIRLAK